MYPERSLVVQGEEQGELPALGKMVEKGEWVEIPMGVVEAQPVEVPESTVAMATPVEIETPVNWEEMELQAVEVPMAMWE